MRYLSLLVLLIHFTFEYTMGFEERKFDILAFSEDTKTQTFYSYNVAAFGTFISGVTN